MNIQSNWQSQYIIKNLFSLHIKQLRNSTKIVMELYIENLYTGTIPSIVALLKQRLPEILRSECFNEENLPFSVEVQNTEIGHLFEHILLEYLCRYKLAKGYRNASYSGRTSWNWVRDPKGVFHIKLNCGHKDADILPGALEKAISLVTFVLQKNYSKTYYAHPMHQLLPAGISGGAKRKKK